jgi:hypothetical protein
LPGATLDQLHLTNDIIPLPKESYFSVENEEKVDKFMNKLRKLIKTLFLGETPSSSL